tara:strand:+ start:146 stop:331 length:186 start_codon:yes stop_codon:yes gene_type:complete
MYKVTLIKDRNPRVKGDQYGPISKKGYMILLEQGYIDDEHNLVKEKKATKKVKKEDLEIKE